MIYRNYHKHTTKSSGFTPDSHIQAEAYFERIKDLGHDRYFTTEHGFGGSVFEALDLQEKYGIKVIYAMEIYIVEDNSTKDATNNHMIIIAKNNKARRMMNLKNSNANEFGYHYKPRWSLSDVLDLNPEDFYVTTACIAGIARDIDTVKKLALPIKQHFGDNFFWEVQNHSHEKEIEHSKLILECVNLYGGKMIHANDSHYIHKDQHQDRASYLKGKGITYGAEDGFVLDYPDSDTILRRYEIQGVLSREQALDALNNTMEIDSDEYIDIDKSIKMPTMYPELTMDERYDKLEQMVMNNWNNEKASKPTEKHIEYTDALRFELDIIKQTNDVVHTSDYFLLNTEVVNRATNKFGGVLTKTGRGSCGSFLVNRFLGLTSLDRIALDVPMFPTRFISKSRLLETRSLPDFDMNVKDPEPFVDATRDILGEHQCYWMIAWGTQQDSGAFKNICRDENSVYKEIHGKPKYSFEEMNKVSQNLDEYENDPKWRDVIKKSKAQVGSVDSMSRSPGSVLIMNQDIREEIGIIRVGDDLCAVITSMEVEDWKYLKNDYLTVTVVRINDEVYNMIGQKQHEVDELIPLLDEKVWEIYKQGLTRTLNQVSTDNGRRQIMILEPKNYSELTAFVAAIRPGFKSLVDTFLQRKPYTNGVKEMDDLLENSNNFLLYQESIMQFLVWLGIEEDITYGIIKKISKKKFKDGELDELKRTLKINWIKKVGREEGFSEAWEVVEDNALYSFNSAHSVAVAFDSLYGAYLKANYPYEYFTVVLDVYGDKLSMTRELVHELDYFGISLKPAVFRYSKGGYLPDKETKSIYKGIGSIKNLNVDCANELYELRNNQYDTFLDLMLDIKEKTSLNKTKVYTLIQLDFFSEFGKAKKLKYVADMYYKWHSKKTAKKVELQFDEKIIRKYSEKETEKQFSKVDYISIIRECEKLLDEEDYTIKEKIGFQKEYLGYVNLTDKNVSNRLILVNGLNTKYSPKFEGYCIKNGKSEMLKVKRKPKRRQPGITYFEDKPFKEGDILFAEKVERKRRMKKVDDEWIYLDEWDFWITKYRIEE